MDSTALPSLRNSAPPRHRQAFVCYVGAVVLGGAALVGSAVPGLVRALTALPPAYWLVLGLAVVVDAQPFRPLARAAHHRQPPAVSRSLCFSFAALLLWGLGPAVLVALAAAVVLFWRLRAAAWRIAFNLAQYTLSYGAAALVLRLLGVGHPSTWSGLLAVAGMLLAAVAWFAVSYLLVCTAVALRFGGAPRTILLDSLGYEALTTGALLLLAPILAAASTVSPWLFVAALLPLYAVYRTARMALDLQRSALVDRLTGLANRKGLSRRIADEIALRADRVAEAGGDGPYGPVLLVLDLDRFKDVNDALGHGVGDRLLQEVGRRLRAGLPDEVLVARLGGDEFAVVLPEVSGVAVARAYAEKVAAMLGGPVHVDGMPLEVASSIGAALHPLHGADFDELLRHADVAMYEAKSRNDAVALYAAEADHNSPARLGLLGDLRRTLERPDRPELGELGVFYQPQVEISTGAVVGVEALLRWRHPEHGMVGPEEVIRAAEHTPVMRLLTCRVIDEVVSQLARWAQVGVAPRAAINVSVRDLHSSHLVDHLAAQLDRHGIGPDQIELEITEGALMADPRRVLATLRQLDRLGVALSLDDFGTGYSSMLHLRRLPLSEVKIDRSFVIGMGADDDDAAIVRSIIELARALGLRVVAEGVEDERTWRRLSELGCQVAQGWFFARPMPATELTSWLGRYRPPQSLRVVEPDAARA
jgi:diguanylate cyclase (GGDEF)-like protein